MLDGAWRMELPMLSEWCSGRGRCRLTLGAGALRKTKLLNLTG